MNFHAQFERLHAFLLNLECLDVAGQRDAFMNEVIESGTYVPSADSNGASHMFEISLHGVVAYGSSESEAIHNWKKAARAQAPLVENNGATAAQPPFPDPRNHWEEIANARASDGTGARP